MRPSETLQIRVPCPVCRGVRGTGPRPHPCGDEVMSGGACTTPIPCRGKTRQGGATPRQGRATPRPGGATPRLSRATPPGRH